MTAALDLFDDAGLDGPVAAAVRRIAVAGFQALWSGRRVTLADLLADDATFRQAADHLRGRGRIELSDEGHVVAVHGLARRPTRHRIEHAGGVVNTWCALDAIGIPPALAIDARALTQCPTCGAELEVTLRRGQPQPLSDAVLWYPEARGDHLVDDFCAGANLFCSVHHLEAWVGWNPSSGTVMTIEEVADVGREVWADVSEGFAAEIDGGSKLPSPSRGT
ncbi:MAG: organomercurial lyase [Acidimicrobiia bacterium]